MAIEVLSASNIGRSEHFWKNRNETEAKELKQENSGALCGTDRREILTAYTQETAKIHKRLFPVIIKTCRSRSQLKVSTEKYKTLCRIVYTFSI